MKFVYIDKDPDELRKTSKEDIASLRETTLALLTAKYKDAVIVNSLLFVDNIPSSDVECIPIIANMIIQSKIAFFSEKDKNDITPIAKFISDHLGLEIIEDFSITL